MALLQLSPSYKDYIWGGHRLVEEYNKQYDGEVLAESWELSCHPDGPSTIMNGAHAGKSLADYIAGEGKEVLGTNCRRFKDFPILIKFIDAKDNLSIQVHPDNKYALKHEGQYGKTEMWYIMDCREGACLYYGFREEISREEFARRIEEDTLLEVLNQVPVHKGDVFFIEAGTIHAIGKDIVIAEIQQNSNVTYRVYDFGRVGKDGKKRELHVDQAVQVTNCRPVDQTEHGGAHMADCDYFTVDKVTLEEGRRHGLADEDSFVSVLIMDGQGYISCGGEKLPYKKGDSFFISAGSGAYEMDGTCEALITTVRDIDSPVRIGIDLGGTDTKIGLVDEEQNLFAEKTIPTGAKRPWAEVIADIGKAAMELLDEEGIPIERCVGAGAGIPGTMDQAKGEVLYSNNIHWAHVPFAKELEKYLPVPIRIANDADCAALGEVADGAARGFRDVIMLTLGTGVGGGVILDGAIYQGRLIGGCELGHMVIETGGEECTCGRKGCLEAYASATAMIRDGRRAMEASPDSLMWEKCGGAPDSLRPEMIFEACKEGDKAAEAVVLNYRSKLEEGIVNLINIFRPQRVVIGGGVSKQGDYLLGDMNETIKVKCFGGDKTEAPEVVLASLGNKAGIVGAANLI